MQSLSRECSLFDLPHALSLLHCMTQQLSAGIFCSFWVDERMDRGKGRDGTIRAKNGRERMQKVIGNQNSCQEFLALYE